MGTLWAPRGCKNDCRYGRNRRQQPERCAEESPTADARRTRRAHDRGQDREGAPELENDLGGADRLTAAQRAIVRRAAVATAMLEDMEANWLSGRPLDVQTYCTLQNAQRRALTTLGLERKPRDVTPDLNRYIAANGQPAEPKPLPAPPPLPQ